MNPLINIDLGFYFEIKNSEMFGGEGSIGYTAINLGGVKNIEAVDDEFVDKKIEDISTMLKVSKENVRLISKEEYDENTEECEDDYSDECEGEE
jgi:hypothetical protein